MGVRIETRPDGTLLLAVKVVPGASRDRVGGVLGDAVKVTVSAPAEGGKANAAVCRHLATVLGLPRRSVTLHQGASSAHKTIRLAGTTEAAVRLKLRV